MSETLLEGVNFETHPSCYRHWTLEVEGDRAQLAMNVQEDKGMRPGYVLKLNSYDLGVDIELADAIQRLRFEHPEVKVVVLTGSLDRVFCAGANIGMLQQSAHAWKVNFCKFTNETRLYIEDASAHSGMRFLCALNGTASGGGYELALACDSILLVDDRSSAVSLPEVPFLGVLPGTGGLTRVVDKRKVRRDLADVFSTTAEGVKGKRAVEWDLVDDIAPLSKFQEKIDGMAQALADEIGDKGSPEGVNLETLDPEITDEAIIYRHVTVNFNGRSAEITVTVPEDAPVPSSGEEARDLGQDWWVFRAFRELDNTMLQLRVNRPETGLVVFRTRGDIPTILETDAALEAHAEHWFVNEVRQMIKRTLKRIDLTAKSFYALIDEGSCFAGTLFELAMASDRTYVLNDPDFPVSMAVSSSNGGTFPMSNGLSRLETRFLGDPDRIQEVLSESEPFDAERADELGLCTSAPDELDWEDEIRVALEERGSFSPDALTGMEANLRFAGPETMETKIFGRLTAWQNWIFQRPNAVGQQGALHCYGTPNSPVFDFNRT